MAYFLALRVINSMNCRKYGSLESLGMMIHAMKEVLRSQMGYGSVVEEEQVGVRKGTMGMIN